MCSYYHTRENKMKSFIRKLLTPSPESIAEIKEELRQEQEEENRALIEKSVAEALEKEKNKQLDGKEPWVNLVGGEIDPEKGIKVKLEWNEAFVKMLRQNGIQGTSDEEIVQRWLALVTKDIDRRHQDETNASEYL